MNKDYQIDPQGKDFWGSIYEDLASDKRRKKEDLEDKHNCRIIDTSNMKIPDRKKSKDLKKQEDKLESWGSKSRNGKSEEPRVTTQFKRTSLDSQFLMP